MKLLLFAAFTAIIFESCEKGSSSSKEDGTIVSDWNAITLNATKKAGYNSNLATRIVAIEAIAVYDAVNAIKKIGGPYHYTSKAKTHGASAQAAVAQAAHDVLLNYFPAQKAYLDSALDASINSINGGGSVTAGAAIGAASARDIIALRQDDNSSPNQTYPGPKVPGVGVYQLTPVAFAPGINQQWGTVKPFVLQTPSQFRPAAPPAPGSSAYNAALAEVKELGVSNSASRTEDQTHIAQFYKQDAELTVNETARQLAINHHSSIEEAAVVFVLTDIAEADVRIALFEAKYNYLFWRPVTSLNANEDGSVTNNYTAWTPLLATPPHPSYPCGHCGTVTAGLEVLKKFYGNNNTVTLHTTTAGEPVRTVNSLSKIEEENERSRVYGGIHYSFDNEAAQKLAHKVADYVLEHGRRKE